MGHTSEVDVSILAGLDRTPSETDNAAEKFSTFQDGRVGGGRRIFLYFCGLVIM